LLLYKAKSVPLFIFKKGCLIKFPKGDVQKVKKFENYWKITIIILFGIEVLFTTIDLVLTVGEINSGEIKNANVKQSGKDILKSEMDNYALDIIQVVLIFIVMYMLAIY
jgi:hypothetical protein